MLAMKYMGKDNGGNGGIVINMSSVLGMKPYAGCPVYCATKYALLGLTRSFGEPYYFEKTGIRMVALCPGTTATDMIHCYAAQEMFEKLGQLVENLPKQMSLCVATAVVELIAKASTGTVWVVENGDEVYEIKQPDYSSCRKSPHAI
ncbi:hypothetical protein J437_LFUL002201 [Ladona fulva]|uniref:Alcohol dehydrogenase n=1 Tax=Ladona fulva TaxID=123851 RepID=A0A8K0JTM4_LADFU|nr:hypothetical protein J437_LFUL002201 [Ladona fulva]